MFLPFLLVSAFLNMSLLFLVTFISVLVISVHQVNENKKCFLFYSILNNKNVFIVP